MEVDIAAEMDRTGQEISLRDDYATAAGPAALVDCAKNCLTAIPDAVAGSAKFGNFKIEELSLRP